MDRMRFDTKALIVLFADLVLSVISGRQLFLDGSYQIIAALNDPFWYPENQPTLRRFASQMWSNGLLRLIGLASRDQIEIAEFIYGTMEFGLILIGAAALVHARSDPKAKYLIVGLYFGGYLVLANFIVSEVAMALTMTTVVVAYTLAPASDAGGWRRLAAASLLFASYEIVAASNFILALTCWRMARLEPTRDWASRALPFVLFGGSIFQIVSYVMNPLPGDGGANHDPTLYILAGLLAGLISATFILFKTLRNYPFLRKFGILSAFAIPCLLFLVPQALRLRTDLFQFAYPARLATMGVVLAISAVPLLLDARLWRWPSSVLNWFGAVAIKDAALCIFSAFCGVSILSSLDAARFFSRLDAELARHPGQLSLRDCAFCRNPQASGTADLGYPWIWKSYSIAVSLSRRDRPFTVIIPPGAEADMPNRAVVAEMIASHDARLARHIATSSSASEQHE